MDKEATTMTTFRAVCKACGLADHEELESTTPYLLPMGTQHGHNVYQEVAEARLVKAQCQSCLARKSFVRSA